MQHTGKRNRTLMGEEWVCRYCCQGWIAIHVGDTGRTDWAVQDMARFEAHGCAGMVAERMAKNLAEALWRTEHAKKIRRRV